MSVPPRRENAASACSSAAGARWQVASAGMSWRRPRARGRRGGGDSRAVAAETGDERSEADGFGGLVEFRFRGGMEVGEVFLQGAGEDVGLLRDQDPPARP